MDASEVKAMLPAVRNHPPEVPQEEQAPSPPPEEPDVEDEWFKDPSRDLPSGWQMKKLKPKHKQVASLLAQGAKNIEIAAMLQITPEYVSMLSRQPLMQAYIREMCQHTGMRLEALFDSSVNVIADTLRNGTESGKLKAARLQLEATHRIGRGDGPPQGGTSTEERLLILSQRLLLLQGARRPPGLYNEIGEEITEAEFSEPVSNGPPEPAQESGAG